MLVLFDVDGTLADTALLGRGIYERTFQAVFGASLPSTDWDTYLHETDRGVAEEALGRLGLAPGGLLEFERRLSEEMRRELSAGRVEPVPGAREAFAVVEAAGHQAAVATGAYEASARVKLAAAGIFLGDRSLVGSGFSNERVAIIREARRRAGGVGPAVYVGDGPWDLRAARAADVGFLGVDPRGSGRLAAAGAPLVLASLADGERLLSALETAARTCCEQRPSRAR
ncbi:MAG TPA: HAD family hydrolase [Anaeromyxobacter sp.]|nr:HAD family hydrolase [Anaeromyxobacter sp.]